MIPARKQRAFNAWFAGHARGRIQRTFAAIRIHGLDRAREISRDKPLLVVSNHTSFWDPLVVLHLSQHLLKTDGYALMDAHNLRRLPFFALVGAFGVDRDRREDGAEAVKYAAGLLDRPGRLCWIFPQGRERPITERPLGFRKGAARIARLGRGAAVIPAAIRYEFGGEERPSLYVSMGPALEDVNDVNDARLVQEAAVEAELARIEEALRGDPAAAFPSVFRQREPVIGALATRVLSMLTRHPTPPTLPPGRSRRDRS